MSILKIHFLAMKDIFNNRLRQIILLSLIFTLFILLATNLYAFLPGLLGGITMYILTRKLYFSLTVKRKWRKSLTALLFILACIVLIAVPVYLSVRLVSPKITLLFNNQDEIAKILEDFSNSIERFTKLELFTIANAQSVSKTISGYIPSLLNSTATLLTNFCMMFFFLYYFLVAGREIEKNLAQIIPLKSSNITKLANETILMVRANALGIPLVSIIHGVIAAIGFLILGIKDWALYSCLTAVFAFFPFVGIMVVWVPLVIYYYSTGQNYTATALAIYSALVTGNVDAITRLGVLKKLGNVHPLITVFGVLVGLKLFGFMGLIFGPLLITYLILLIKIYLNEFGFISDHQETNPGANKL